MYVSRVVAVGTEPTPLGEAESLILQNLSGAVVYIGGPGVTADATAAGGIELAAGDKTPLHVHLPAAGVGGDKNLYGRVAPGTAAAVAVLYRT